jgi:phage terminase large subunit
MNPALKEFWQTKSRSKILYGGRASSKSWDAAANAIRIANFCKVRVLCARKFQNKIEESVYALLVSTIDRFNLQDDFEILKTKIISKKTGSEFLFYGIARNIKEIKGLEGIDILWLEEAEDITKDDYGILEATIRKEGSEIWVIFNPRLKHDFAYQNFVVNPPKNALVRQINYTENPFISKTALDDINALMAANYDEYQHRYLGIPRDDNDSAIIKLSWLESCIDAHIKLGIEPTGQKRIGFDVADDGNDKNAIVIAHGVVAIDCQEWEGLEDKLLQSASRVYETAKKHDAEIDYDSIGVGAMAGSKFDELNKSGNAKIVYRKFNAGGAVLNPNREYQPNVKNKDQFSNIKAQAWRAISERIMLTHLWVTDGKECDPSEIISLSSDLPHLKKLIVELSTPHKDYDQSGKEKVESKKDLAKRGIDSPNLADAFIMAFMPVQRAQKTSYSDWM